MKLPKQRMTSFPRSLLKKQMWNKLQRPHIGHRSTKHSGCWRKLLLKGASHEPCDSSWSESGSRKRLDASSCEPVLSLRTSSVTTAIESRSCTDEVDSYMPGERSCAEDSWC